MSTDTINGLLTPCVIRSVHLDNITRLKIKAILATKLNAMIAWIDANYVFIETKIVRGVLGIIMIIKTVMLVSYTCIQIPMKPILHACKHVQHLELPSQK